MIPVSDTPPLKAQSPLRGHCGHSVVDYGEGKHTATKSCFLGLGRHQCALLLFLLLSLKLLLAFLPSPSTPLHRVRIDSPFPSVVQCSSGRVFVYDLPSAFNQDLIGSCGELNPWASRCVVLPNGGFGVSSTDLAGVVPDSLLPYWYATDQFSGEIIYHRRMLAHRCRTRDASSAAAFYVPFYAGLAIGKHLWSSSSNYSSGADQESRMLLRWVQEQDPWRRSGGRDHFMMFSRVTWDFRRPLGGVGGGGWGGSILNMPAMQNVTRLLVESNPWDDNDVSVPFPTGFHPNEAAQVSQWQQFVLARPRPKLFGFAGAARAYIKEDFRGVLMEECRRAGGKCGLADCGGGRCDTSRSRETVSLFLDSEFCLQPRGDSYARKSMFDCMVAGAVPVVFWNRTTYRQYPWYLPEEAGEWSVFVDRKEVRSGAVGVRDALEAVGEDRIVRMRERVVEFIPRLIYGGAEDGIGGGVRDAFDVAVDGVLRRFRQQRAGQDGR